MGVKNSEEMAKRFIIEADDEILLTLKEFGYLFNRTRDACAKAAQRKSLPGAVKVANQWYVLVSHRIVRAAHLTKESRLSCSD